MPSSFVGQLDQARGLANGLRPDLLYPDGVDDVVAALGCVERWDCRRAVEEAVDVSRSSLPSSRRYESRTHGKGHRVPASPVD